jgi:hypothetical protein
VREDPFACWYSLAEMAARFGVTRRTVLREVDKTPVLSAAAKRMFDEVYLPWPAVENWIRARPGWKEIPSAAPVAPRRVAGRFFSSPVMARSDGELRRRASKRLEVRNA